MTIQIVAVLCSDKHFFQGDGFDTFDTKESAQKYYKSVFPPAGANPGSKGGLGVGPYT